LQRGATRKAGEEEKPPSPCGLLEANANIVRESVRSVVCGSSPRLGGLLLLL
jgi:hypothetical protein